VPNFGAIYIVHNPRDGEHIYKVGKTERDVESRIAELNADTTNLGAYSACAFFVVSDVNAAEQACHTRLSQYRVQENREFFGLELRRLLPLVQEAVKPFLAQSLVPAIPERDADTSELKVPLSERLQRQRESAIKAEGARRSKEEQAKAELLARIKAWREELDTKIRVVRVAYADLDCIRWEEGWSNLQRAEVRKWIGPSGAPSLGLIQDEASRGPYRSLHELIARVEARHEYKQLKNVYKERALREMASRLLAEGKLPASRGEDSVREIDGTQLQLITHVSLYSMRTGKAESDKGVEPLRLGGQAEGQEKLDDARVVGELLMVLRGGVIQVAAFSVHGQVGSIQGEASCASPDEAIDLLGALISEYAANPITRAGAGSGYKTALLALQSLALRESCHPVST
jgi:hypothetical protein